MLIKTIDLKTGECTKKEVADTDEKSDDTKLIDCLLRKFLKEAESKPTG